MGRGPSIEARKNASDAKRGKIFTKMIREISVAARAAGGDPDYNPRLRACIDKALAANMSKDVIERSLKKRPANWTLSHTKKCAMKGMRPAVSQ